MNSINLIFRHVQVSGTSESFANRLYFCFYPCFQPDHPAAVFMCITPGSQLPPLELLECWWLGRLLPCSVFHRSYFPRVEKHGHAGVSIAAGCWGGEKGRTVPLTVQSMWLVLVRALLASCLSTSGPHFHRAWLFFSFLFFFPLSPRSQRPRRGGDRKQWPLHKRGTRWPLLFLWAFSPCPQGTDLWPSL